MMKAKALVPKHNRIRRSRGDIVFDIINVIIVVLITLTMIYPMWYVIIVSFATPEEAVMGRLYIWPKTFTLEAYEKVFENKDIWTGYLNTIIYTVAHTLYVLILTVPPAYALSKKQLPGRVAITWYFFATMFISGGLIPGYLLNKALHLIDTVWVMIIPGISAYNVVLYRTFFQGNAMQLREAAMIDGAGEFRIYLRIVTPLSIAIYATLGLFSLVGNWNGWFGAMIYLRREELFPYQLLLRRILDSITTTLQRANQGDDEYLRQAMQNSRYNARNIQMAAIFIGMAPILCVYPFVQKYFVKGVFVGSIKG